MENIPNLDDVLHHGPAHADPTLRRPSLPRRDGQGRRRSWGTALLVLISSISACGGIARQPVDNADSSPPTSETVPPVESSRVREGSQPVRAGAFDLDVVGEASGLARSVRNPGITYVLDDGPGSTGVVAVAGGSAPTTEVHVEGLDGRDTEGLAVAPCESGTERSCLYIGDIGNNQQAWTSVRVWRVPEPPLDEAPSALLVDGDVATYTYPDEPVDAEALLLEDGRPFLVTKERSSDVQESPPPRLLGATAFADGALRDLGAIALPEPASGGFAGAFFGNVVTGGEAVGGLVVLRTYDHVLVYQPPSRGADLSTLATWVPREIDTPLLGQAEAVTADHCGLWLTSEGVDSIWLVPAELPLTSQRNEAPHTPADELDQKDEEQVCPTGSVRSSPARPAASERPSPGG